MNGDIIHIIIGDMNFHIDAGDCDATHKAAKLTIKIVNDVKSIVCIEKFTTGNIETSLDIDEAMIIANHLTDDIINYYKINRHNMESISENEVYAKTLYNILKEIKVIRDKKVKKLRHKFYELCNEITWAENSCCRIESHLSMHGSTEKKE